MTTIETLTNAELAERLRHPEWCHAQGERAYLHIETVVPDMREAAKRLAAAPAPSAPVSEAVGIRPLEWVEPNPDNNGCWTANCAFGVYSAVNEDGWYVTLEDHPWGKTFEWSAPDMRNTREDAMAAAQADFEARVRSCLVSAPIAEADVLRAALANSALLLRSIRYHADNGHQDRPLHVRLSLISKEANWGLSEIDAALNAERQTTAGGGSDV